jgi:hypothetical protein
MMRNRLFRWFARRDSTHDGPSDSEDSSLFSTTLWELAWGLVAVVAVGVWMDQQAGPLQLAIDNASRKNLGTAGLLRLEDDELRARRRWLAAILRAYENLRPPIRWSDTLSHLATSLPEDGQLLQFRGSNPLPPSVERDQIYTVQLLATGSQVLQDRLHADSYWGKMFNQPRLQSFDGGTFQLSASRPGKGAEGGAP